MPPPKTLLLAVLLGVAVLLSARGSAAAPPTQTVIEALRVEPNRCFDASSLAPVLVRWLHRDAIDRRLKLEVTNQSPESAKQAPPPLAESPTGLMLRIWRDGRQVSERPIDIVDVPCEDLRAAVGLLSAIAVDVTVLESLGVPPREQVPPSPSPPSPPVRPYRLGLVASANAVVLFGVLPATAAAVAPGFGVRPMPRVELRLSGLITAAGTLTLERRSVDVSLLAGRADVCAALLGSFARFRFCTGLAAGRLDVTTSGPKVSVSPTEPWAAALGRADVRLSLSPWMGFVLGADAIVPLTHSDFEVVRLTGAPVATSSLPTVGAAISLGPEITFR